MPPSRAIGTIAFVPDYQALYRKYRPQGFAEVVGQTHVTETLAREVQSGKVAHAYLFTGPRGTGKTTTARILAKALNCQDRRPDGEPCNVCFSCVGITEGSSMDVIELDAASHNKVEDVREIRANVGTVASIGGARRVYILDEAHMLSRAASNALLKTLEEPPEHAHFVLATTEPYKLPDTIRSRTQRFDFHPIGSEALIAHLDRVARAEGIKASHEGLSLIVRHAGGSARDALGLLEQVAALGGGKVDPSGVARALGLAGDDAFTRLVAAIADGDVVAGLTLVAGLASRGADLRRFVTDSLEVFRGLFLAQYAPNLEEIVDESAERLDEWRGLARSLPPTEVLRCIDRLGAALVDLREGREERLVVELTVLQMCRPETSGDLPAVIARMDRLEERLRRVQSAPPGPDPTPLQPETRPAPAAPAVSEPGPALPVGTEEARPRLEVVPPVESHGGPQHAPVASPPVEGLDIDAVEAAWPAAIARIREDAGLRRFALFREARPVAVEGATVVLEIPGNLPFHLAQLGEDDLLNRVVVAVLSDLVGGTVTIAYRSGEAVVTPEPVAVPQPTRAPDRDTLEESAEGAIDPAKLVADLLDGEVIE